LALCYLFLFLLGLIPVGIWYKRRVRRAIDSLTAAVQQSLSQGEMYRSPELPPEWSSLQQTLHECFQHIYHTEQQQRQQNAWLQQAIDSTHSVVWRWDGQDDLVFLPSEYMTPPSFSLWLQRIHSDDRPRVTEGLRRQWTEPPIAFQFIYRIQNLKGEWRWHQLHGIAQRDFSGETQCLIGLYRDVTDEQSLDRATRTLAQTLPLKIADYAQTLLHALCELHHASQAIIILFPSATSEQGIPWLVWREGQQQSESPFSPAAFTLDQSPYAQTVKQGSLSINQHLLGHYPRVPPFDNVPLHSYLGSLLIAPQNDQMLGLIAVLGVRPLQVEKSARHLFSRYARRLAFELARLPANEFDQLLGFQRSPVASAISSPPAETSMKSPKNKGEVLVVDDSPINQDMVASMLKRLHYHCDTANNGLYALQFLQQHHYDVVLMDCEMPEMDGYTATREWRTYEQTHQLPRTPIIALTANALAEHRQVCVDAGMDGFLTKPLRFKVLRDTLEHWTASPMSDSHLSDCFSDPHPAAEATPCKQLPVLEHSVLHSLQKIMGADLHPLLQQFIYTLPAQVVELNDLFAHAQWEMLARKAHRLRGESLQIGAMRIGQLCQFIELEAKSNSVSPESLSILLPQLSTELTAFTTAISEVLPHD
jgi:CheY-like chemotaxis protein/PAS domain-containing protein